MTGYLIAFGALAVIGLLARFAYRQQLREEIQKRENHELEKAKETNEREREAITAVQDSSFDDVLDLNDRLRRERKD